jgi:hypothetical protein
VFVSVLLYIEIIFGISVGILQLLYSELHTGLGMDKCIVGYFQVTSYLE